MFNSLRHLSWVFSIALHVLVLAGGAYVSTGTHVKIDLNKKMYEVNLVGTPHKGKPGARSAPKLAAAQETPKKAAPKEAPPVKAAEEQKKPEKKTVPADTAKAIPKETVNATKVAEAEEPKKEEPKKEEPKKDTKDIAAKADAKNATKVDSKNATKTEKKPSKEEILAAALGEASKTAKTTTKGGAEGAAKGDAKGSSKNALADALADIGREVSGRGTSGDGTAEDGPGEGESAGTLDEYYASQVVKAIRENWRFPRLSNVVLAATVELRLSRSGEILGSRVLNGSGRPDFDASVKRAVEDTKRLPQVPESLDTTIVITFYNTENQ
ncbi:MAG: cell envelope integrity protein TolA [Desulfovibrionales bacterium]|nr:cell envelope integrity protein TolA [Desulfovibrionales bacterium]